MFLRYVFICMCIHICIHVCVCIHIHIYTYIHIYIIYIWYTYVYICTCVHIYVCTCICMSIYIYKCLYIYERIWLLSAFLRYVYKCVSWRLQMCDMTYLPLWHDLLIRMIWFMGIWWVPWQDMWIMSRVCVSVCVCVFVCVCVRCLCVRYFMALLWKETWNLRYPVHLCHPVALC